MDDDLFGRNGQSTAVIIGIIVFTLIVAEIIFGRQQ